MGKFKITCDEATAICDKNQYGEAKISDKLKLIIHFFSCKICKCYSQQNNKMTEIYNGYSKNKCNKHNCLTSDDKEKIEEAVKEKME